MRIQCLVVCAGLLAGGIACGAQEAQRPGAYQYQAQVRDKYVAKHPQDMRLHYAPPPPRLGRVKKLPVPGMYPPPAAENMAGAENALKSQEQPPAPDAPPQK